MAQDFCVCVLFFAVYACVVFSIPLSRTRPNGENAAAQIKNLTFIREMRVAAVQKFV